MFRGELPRFAILEPPAAQLVKLQLATSAE
jgi:hypothetical protein